MAAGDGYHDLQQFAARAEELFADQCSAIDQLQALQQQAEAVGAGMEAELDTALADELARCRAGQGRASGSDGAAQSAGISPSAPTAG
jgi:hypothetical protein